MVKKLRSKSFKANEKRRDSNNNNKTLKYFVMFCSPVILVQLLLLYKFKPSNLERIAAEISNSSPNYYQSSNTNGGKREENSSPASEGSFNGYPISYYKTDDNNNEQIFTQVHCIGESYQPDFFLQTERETYDVSWQHRSCQFQFFCYDMDVQKYVIFQNPKERETLSIFPKTADVQQTYITDRAPTNDESTPSSYGVSIGGINQKWTISGIIRLKWYPEIRTDLPKSFYSLPADVVMIPFHSLASFNPGHLVWDDFLPLFTLMNVFQLDNLRLLAMRYILDDDERALWASCDWRDDRRKDCQKMLEKFGTLMVSNPDTVLPFTTSKEPRFILDDKAAKPKSNLICAKNGLAGLGSLTDHGTKKGHGWEEQDYELVHNHGRGGQFWKFRNFMMKNLDVPVDDAPPSIDPIKIVFSDNSSTSALRNYNWDKYISALEETDLGPNVVIERYTFRKHTLKEQVDIIRNAAIFVTAAGGGAVTATFLPRGATAIIFYGARAVKKGGKKENTPARLDFDYFNNMGYIRTHWIGSLIFRNGKRRRWIIKSSPDHIDKSKELLEMEREGQEDIQGFVTLIKHDLNIIRRERLEYDETSLLHTHRKEERPQQNSSNINQLFLPS